MFRIRVRNKNKYRNIKCSCDGFKFDSLSEMNHYKELKLREAAGELKLLSLQPKVYLTASKILYKPDFEIFDNKLNAVVYIDYKGVRTAAFQIKRRLWKCYGPGILRIVATGKVEDVVPTRN